MYCHCIKILKQIVSRDTTSLLLYLHTWKFMFKSAVLRVSWMGNIYTCCKRWRRFFALAQRVWFIGQLKPNLLITTSITLVAAKIICPRPLQPCNLKCLAQSALHINLPLGFRQEQTWLFIFILNDSNVRRFENVNCNTCICSVGSKSLTPKYLRPSNPVGVQFGTSIRKYGNTDPYFYICLGLYHLFGILG